MTSARGCCLRGIVKSKRRDRSTLSRSWRVDVLARHATDLTTAEGKAISSQNVRKHRLNAPPPEDLVTQWFNTILNKGGDVREQPNAEDPRREAALRLAIAEARYHRGPCTKSRRTTRSPTPRSRSQTRCTRKSSA